MCRLFLSVALCALWAAELQAQSPGTTTAADHTFARAGFPDVIAPWARPGRTAKEMPGIVGGSVALGGDAPVARTEGIFGCDHTGFGPPGRVFLGWAHDPVRPVMGSYRTDGPRVFDVFSIHPVRRALSGDGEK
jgi:hypothetical protein